MPKATDEPNTPPLRLGQHPRHPQRPALVNEAGQAQCTFPSDATRAEIAERLRAGGFVLRDDNTVTKAEASDAPDTPAPEIAAAVVALTAPSALDLGRQLAAVDLAHEAFDMANVRHPGADGSRSLAHDYKQEATTILRTRAEALRNLITTVPAKTLADAAVLCNEIVVIADRLNAHDDPSPSQVNLAMERINRMALGMLPIVAAAAGLDMEAMRWSDALRIRRFYGVGVAA